jgi:drug/metabolite transporter (DMT)-like permease
MAAILFGLASALSWGAGDFSGGLATRRTSVFGVIALMHAVGLGLVIALALALGNPLPSWQDAAWGAAGGLAGAVGLASLYRALAQGQMGIAAPLTAVLATTIPVVFSLWAEGLPELWQIAGFSLGLLSIWIISRGESGARWNRNVAGLILLGGLGFGSFAIMIDQISADAVLWPLATARIASIALMLMLAHATRQLVPPARDQLNLIALAGVLDMGGNAFFLLATQAGRLDVAAVLSSLYPAVTVILARVLLHERISRRQTVGIGAALAAIPLIAL